MPADKARRARKGASSLVSALKTAGQRLRGKQRGQASIREEDADPFTTTDNPIAEPPTKFVRPAGATGLVRRHSKGGSGRSSGGSSGPDFADRLPEEVAAAAADVKGPNELVMGPEGIVPYKHLVKQSQAEPPRLFDLVGSDHCTSGTRLGSSAQRGSSHLPLSDAAVSLPVPTEAALPSPEAHPGHRRAASLAARAPAALSDSTSPSGGGSLAPRAWKASSLSSAPSIGARSSGRLPSLDTMLSVSSSGLFPSPPSGGLVSRNSRLATLREAGPAAMGDERGHVAEEGLAPGEGYRRAAAAAIVLAGGRVEASNAPGAVMWDADD